MNGTSDDLYNFITYTLWDQSKESNISYTIRDKDTEKLLACGLLLTEEQMPKVTEFLCVCVCVCVCDSPDMANRDSNVNTLCT